MSEKHNQACQKASQKLRNASTSPNEIFTKKHIDLISEETKDMDPNILRLSLANQLIQTKEYEKARSFLILSDKSLRYQCFEELVQANNIDLAITFLTKEEKESILNPPDDQPPGYEEPTTSQH